MAAGQEGAFGRPEVGQGTPGETGRQPEAVAQQQAHRPRTEPPGGIEAEQHGGTEG